MTDIHIPPAALEAGVKAANDLDPYYVNREQIRAAFLAIVEAWPGMVERRSWDGSLGRLILPLPTQENGDD